MRTPRPLAVFLSAPGYSAGNRARLLAFVMLTAVVVACGDPTAPTDTVTGTYVLSTINSSPLPFVDSHTYTDAGVSLTFKQTVNTGSLTVKTDNTYGVKFNQRVQVGTIFDQTSTDSSTGTWALSGSDFTISFKDTTSTSPLVITTKSFKGTWAAPTLSLTVVDTVKTSTGSIGFISSLIYKFTKQ